MKPTKKETNQSKMKEAEESCCSRGCSDGGCSSEHGKAKKETCCGGCGCG